MTRSTEGECESLGAWIEELDLKQSSVLRGGLLHRRAKMPFPRLSVHSWQSHHALRGLKSMAIRVRDMNAVVSRSTTRCAIWKSLRSAPTT